MILGIKAPTYLTCLKTYYQSVIANPQVVHDYLEKEILLNRVTGPFKHPPLVNLQCSPIGLACTKKGWLLENDHRPISPKLGSSVNDYILQEEFSVQYFKFDDAVNMIANLARSWCSDGQI